MKKAKLMKRFLSLLLVISMVLSCAPYTAEAAEVEAKWGTSASRLTNSGTYLDAIKAATAANSRIKYIQLQSTVYLTQGYDVSSGTFTIDLNDHQLRNRDSVLVVQSGANVTVTDTSAGGGGRRSGGGISKRIPLFSGIYRACGLAGGTPPRSCRD